MVPPTAPYLVRVSVPSGQNSDFMVRGGELVRDLKQKICLAHSVPMEQQRLVFKQQVLPDSSTFQSVGILSGAALNLVLDTNSAPAINYTCPSATPTLSIHHFFIGLNAQQLSYFPQPPQGATPSHVALPPHTTHLVHMHDTQHAGIKMFLQYLYTHKLEGESASKTVATMSEKCLPPGETSSYVMCYILGTYFDVPGLSQACLSAIETCLTIETVLLEFSRTLQNQPLKQLCVKYMNSQQNTHH